MPDAKFANDDADFHMFIRISRGDLQAWERVIRRNNKHLHRFPCGILGDDREAEDVVQETYLHAFTHANGFISYSSLSTWLSSIALDEVRRRLRQRRNMASLADIEETTPEDAVRRNASLPVEDLEQETARAEVRCVLKRAIDQLTPNFRAVFLLCAVKQMAAHEAAEILAIQEETVRTRLRRACVLLAKVLGETVHDALLDADEFTDDRVITMVLHRLKRVKGRQVAIADNLVGLHQGGVIDIHVSLMSEAALGV